MFLYQKKGLQQEAGSIFFTFSQWQTLHSRFLQSTHVALDLKTLGIRQVGCVPLRQDAATSPSSLLEQKSGGDAKNLEEEKKDALRVSFSAENGIE